MTNTKPLNEEEIKKKWLPILNDFTPITEEMRQKIKEGKIKTTPVIL